MCIPYWRTPYIQPGRPSALCAITVLSPPSPSASKHQHQNNNIIVRVQPSFFTLTLCNKCPVIAINSNNVNNNNIIFAPVLKSSHSLRNLPEPHCWSCATKQAVGCRRLLQPEQFSMRRFQRLFFEGFQSTLQRLYTYEGAQEYFEKFAMRLLYYEGSIKTLRGKRR